MDRKDYSMFADIVTNYRGMYDVFNLVKIFAGTLDSVLLMGETGTGKDLIARKIYELSGRREMPFISVNLASISPTLFESELFGHMKGSFTGATGDKVGYFEAANGGTIFLDEIGEIPIELQGKLLRVIQYGEIYRIGSSKPIKLDIRIISATNKNLLTEIKKGKFRSDLYYRLTRCIINLPTLRERRDDVLLLAEHFIREGNRIYNKDVLGFNERVKDLLLTYNFPGNIRELENIILNGVVTAYDGTYIEKLVIPSVTNIDKFLEQNGKLYNPKEAIDDDAFAILSQMDTLEKVSNDYILYVLRKTNNVEKSAKILGMTVRTLQRRLKTIKEKQ